MSRTWPCNLKSPCMLKSKSQDKVDDFQVFSWFPGVLKDIYKKVFKLFFLLIDEERPRS
jgi:hypothetical protein